MVQDITDDQLLVKSPTDFKDYNGHKAALIKGIAQSKTPLQKFYEGKVVLITGGTGFLGKLIVEKLLRVCQDIGHIYIIVRHKRGKTGLERLEEYFNDAVFDRLKKENPKCKEKLSGITGDMTSPELGLNEIDQNMLKNKVNIVIHAAATVSFTEKIQIAVKINLLGTKEILELAKNMKNLTAFVHVSTAYSNCHVGDIDERVYEYPGSITWKRLIALMEILEDSHLGILTKPLMGNWPNTYTFTKALTEKMLVELKDNVPLGIFRPAIVVSTAHEPIPGWIDNTYGPTGVVAGVFAGIIRIVRANPKCLANIVPGDMVASAIIASAWDISVKYERKNQNLSEEMLLPIYNYVSIDNKITWGEIYHSCKSLKDDYPFSNAIWQPSFLLCKHKYIYDLLTIFLHYIPSHLYDVALRIAGKPAKIANQMAKIEKLLCVLDFFSNRSWHYGTLHTVTLWNKLSNADKQLFDFSIHDLEWQPYLVNYVSGVRKYLLKDDLSTLPAAKKRAQKLFWINQLFMITVILIFCSIFYILFQYI